MKDGVAVLGRLDLMLGVAAVAERQGNKITLCEAGKIGFVSESALRLTDEDGSSISQKRGGMLTTAQVNVVQYSIYMEANHPGV